MRSRVFAQLVGNLIAGLFALMFLQGCGLKGNLYLEGEEDSSATITEQENQEFLKESLEEQTEDVGLDTGLSFEEENENILNESQEEPLIEEDPMEIIRGR